MKIIYLLDRDEGAQPAGVDEGQAVQVQDDLVVVRVGQGTGRSQVAWNAEEEALACSLTAWEVPAMGGTPPQVWILAEAGDIVRADAIVAVRLDTDGAVSARVRGEAKATVTLVAHTAGVPVPEDFHRQMIRAIAELADASGAQLVRAHHDDGGWRWTAEPL